MYKIYRSISRNGVVCVAEYKSASEALNEIMRLTTIDPYSYYYLA